MSKLFTLPSIILTKLNRFFASDSENGNFEFVLRQTVLLDLFADHRTPPMWHHHNGVLPNTSEQPKQKLHIRRREVFCSPTLPVSYGSSTQVAC